MRKGREYQNKCFAAYSKELSTCRLVSRNLLKREMLIWYRTKAIVTVWDVDVYRKSFLKFHSLLNMHTNTIFTVQRCIFKNYVMLLCKEVVNKI